MRPPKKFYVDKNKNNLQHLASLGYLQQGSVNLEDGDHSVLYVNNTEEDIGFLRANLEKLFLFFTCECELFYLVLLPKIK